MGNRLSKIYTRTGDGGDTGLGDGSRVDKDSLRVATYGTVDELNSVVGLVLACELEENVSRCLTRVQHELFDLGGELCMPGHELIPARFVDQLEADLDGFNQDLPPLKDFVLPGGGSVTPRIVGMYRSGYEYGPNARHGDPRTFLYQPAWTKWDAYLSWLSPSGTIKATLFGRNIFNKDTIRNGSTILGGSRGWTKVFLDAPAMYGFEVQFVYN